MSGIPSCPTSISAEFDELLERLAASWRDAPSRPTVSPQVLSSWRELLTSWINDPSLPLLVRKIPPNGVRGENLKHTSGRSLVPADNTPANWVLSLALAGECPSLDDIRLMVDGAQIPVAMMFKPHEKDRAWQRGTRGSAVLNTLGWKVCHIKPVGLGRGEGLRQRPLDELERHFMLFMSPENMFVVPKVLGGLGELPHFTRVMTPPER